MAVRNLQDLGENLQRIIVRLMNNENLIKYLYYTDKDPLSHPKLTVTEKNKEIFHKLIRIIPRVGSTETAQSIVVLRVVSAEKADENSEFKVLHLGIESFVPLEQWKIKGDNLRPFSIMGEIENSLNGKKIDGLGPAYSTGFRLEFVTEEISCYQQFFTITLYD